MKRLYTATAIIFIALGLAACGSVSREVAHYTGHSEMCVDGVKYIQFSSGASVKYDAQGHVVTCN